MRSDGSDPGGGPDNTLSPSGSLDSDDVRNRDGDVVVDPPLSWLDPRDDETLSERLASERPDIAADTPHDVIPSRQEGVPLGDQVHRHAEVVDGVIVADSRSDRGQVDGAPEDGDSFFPIDE